MAGFNFVNQEISSFKITDDRFLMPVCIRRYLPLENLTTLRHLCSSFYSLLRTSSSLPIFPPSLTISQLTKLRRLLVHAFQTVPYYSDLFGSLRMKVTDVEKFTVVDFLRLPIIKRENLSGSKREAFVSKHYHPHDLIRIKTSGTTGDPLEILFTKNDFQYLNMVRLRTQMLSALKPWDRILIILAERDIKRLNKELWFQKIGLFKIKYVNAYDKIDSQVSAIQTYNPDIIIGYPTLLMQLADKIRRITKGNKRRIRKIFTSGEILTQVIRKYIEEAFCAKITNFYGSGEFECIAFECANCHKYHVNTDTIILEVIKEDGSYAKPGESGFMVGTNLHSFAMPIVRYMIGDIVQVSSSRNNECRFGYPSLEKIIRGRDAEYIQLQTGEKVSLFKLKLIVKQFGNLIKQFQFQQRQDGQLSLIIFLAQPIKTNITNAISEEFKRQFNIRLKVILSDKFIRSWSGKVPEYISSDARRLERDEDENSYSRTSRTWY